MKLLLVVLLACSNVFSNENESVPIGVVELVEGSADLERQSQTYSLKEEWEIYEDDIIRVHESSHVKIVLTDESTLDLPAKSKIKIASYLFKEKDVSIIELIFGEIRAVVSPKSASYNREVFHIKTKTAVVGVRGTDFLTSIDEATEEVEVTTFEGEVEVGEKAENNKIVNPQKVAPGFFLRAQRNMPLKAAQMQDKKRFQEMKQKSFRQPDMGKRARMQNKIQDFKQKQNEFRQKRNDFHQKRGDGNTAPNNIPNKGTVRDFRPAGDGVERPNRPSNQPGDTQNMQHRKGRPEMNQNRPDQRPQPQNKRRGN